MDQPQLTRIFVYGSLRRGFNSPAYSYISQYFDLIGNGTIAGCLHDLGDIAAAVPRTNCERRIVGELYEIRNPDEFGWAIAQLDDYEGVNPSYDEERHYYRAVTPVLLEDGSEHEAWIYWYAHGVENFPIVESGDVLEYFQSKYGGH